MQETQIWPLGWEGALEEGKANHSTILTVEFHGQRNMASYSPWDYNKLQMYSIVIHSF